jgi:hypothetical protein
VEDAYGNRYIAELVPADGFPPPSRWAHGEDYYTQHPPSRRAEVYEDDAYRMPPPMRSRAYSHMPEPASVDRRSRAYSQIPEQDPRIPHRAYSVHPATAPQHRGIHEPFEATSYDRRLVPSSYDEQTSPRAAAYTSEYQPIPRAYSVRPDTTRRDVIPEYSSTRAGSMAPTGYVRRGEMAPPTLPIVRSRDTALADDGYRYVASNDGRTQYDDRRVVSYRY